LILSLRKHEGAGVKRRHEACTYIHVHQTLAW